MSPLSPLLLGERLAQLRARLNDEAVASAGWSCAHVARAARVRPKSLARLEATGTGTAAVLTAVLGFYQDQGFNLAWVLAPDNAQVPPRAFRDVFHDTDKRQASHALRTLPPLLHPVAAALDAGQAPAREALRALIERVQANTHLALAYMLPPIGSVLNEVDLREYQRYLPPVLARSSGWRSRAIDLLPYHYYAAGEALPGCGNPYHYLTYDAGPVAVADILHCTDCRAHRAAAGEGPAFAWTAQRYKSAPDGPAPF